MDQRSKLEFKRLLGIILGVLSLITAYLGFDASYTSHKELLKLDQVKLDQAILK